MGQPRTQAHLRLIQCYIYRSVTRVASAQGCLGRTRKRKRLAENAFKMAAVRQVQSLCDKENANEDIALLLEEVERPVHTSISLGKIICPHTNCLDKKLFYFEQGIAHHYKVCHKQEWKPSLMNESTKIAKKLHEEETRDCVEKLFECRRTNVGIFPCRLFLECSDVHLSLVDCCIINIC